MNTTPRAEEFDANLARIVDAEYARFRKVAEALMARERRDHTLGITGVLHATLCKINRSNRTLEYLAAHRDQALRVFRRHCRWQLINHGRRVGGPRGPRRYRHEPWEELESELRSDPINGRLVRVLDLLRTQAPNGEVLHRVFVLHMSGYPIGQIPTALAEYDPDCDIVNVRARIEEARTALRKIWREVLECDRFV